MDHYAADENYFTDEGLQKGHEALVEKLDEKKRQHVEAKQQRKAEQQAARRAEHERQLRRRRTILMIAVLTLIGGIGGWMLSLFAF